MKEAVEAFWNNEACGERYGDDQARLRYKLEPAICEFANFPAATGRRVLEVGIGMGADFLEFVRAGAIITGIDLTERAIARTAEALEREGLDGDIRVADAEQLPFDDGAFDLVYSWGVLHHSPSPGRALSECQRVLTPGGELRVMLYHRHSWVALAAWARFCALRGRVFANLRDAVSMVESPGTQAFTVAEMPALLAGMVDVQVRPHLTHWDRRVAPGISRLLGDRFGWFLLISARKASAPVGLAAQTGFKERGSEGVWGAADS